MEEFLRSWVPLLVSILAFGTSGWGILQGPARKNAEAIKTFADDFDKLMEKLEARLGEAESQITTITTELRHLPDREATHRLEMAIERLDGRIGLLDERLRPVAAISERMQELMVQQAAQATQPTQAPRGGR